MNFQLKLQWTYSLFYLFLIQQSIFHYFYHLLFSVIEYSNPRPLLYSQGSTPRYTLQRFDIPLTSLLPSTYVQPFLGIASISPQEEHSFTTSPQYSESRI